MDEKGNTLFLESPVAGRSEGSSETSDRLYLIVLAGGIPGAMLPLIPGANWIGRAPDNALQLVEASVSRRHALLQVLDGSHIELMDEGSSNGTFINNQKLKPHAPAPLKDGDRIRFGSSFVLKFVRTDPMEERFQREMFERTVRDSLTGLYNRSYFFSQYPAISQGAVAAGMGLAVLMLDIDRFKRFNDTFGHDAGDAVLREVANVLRQATRSDDLVARYGGEEFLLALPVPSLNHALDRAERIRRALAMRKVRLRPGAPSVQVTASIGVAFAPPERPRSAETLISAADMYLYEAKEQGRNCIIGPSPAAKTLSDVQKMTTDGEIPVVQFGLDTGATADLTG